MTRQLSELSNMKDFHFKITSLNPINPTNEVDAFESRALKYFEKTKKSEYFELNQEKSFRYMGALVTTKDCLPCHAKQGYMVGDIRGGISINLDISEYRELVSSLEFRVIFIKLLILFLLLSITLLIHKQMKSNETLKIEVLKRTKELQTISFVLFEESISCKASCETKQLYSLLFSFTMKFTPPFS